MLFARLNNSDLEASRIGFGCWAIGGTDWGPVDDNESIRAVRKALDCGINFFDTADVYGNGHSEEILATALAAERKNVIVATKFGGVREKGKPPRHDTSRKHIMNAIDSSLRRLRTDYIDLYQVHVPDPSTPISETVTALMELRDSGKIRYIGLSNMNVDQVAEYMKHGPITTLQPVYSMIERQSEKELFPFCQANGIAVLAYSPLGRGLLTGKYDKETSFPANDVRYNDTAFQGKIFEINLECVERLRGVASDSGRTVTQLAIAWALSNPAVSVALVGAKTPSQVEENATAFDAALSPETLDRIAEILDDTEHEKDAFRKSQIDLLRNVPITETKSEEKGKELLEALIMWILYLHGDHKVGADILLPVYSNIVRIKTKGTVGQEANMEEMRLKLAEIHSNLETNR